MSAKKGSEQGRKEAAYYLRGGSWIRYGSQGKTHSKGWNDGAKEGEEKKNGGVRFP